MPIRLTNNSAVGGSGGGIYFDSCKVLQKSCFLIGIDALSPAQAVVISGNYAKSGGGIFVACDSLGECSNSFDSQNRVGSLPLVRRAEMLHNMAAVYGHTLATEPAQMRWHGASPHKTQVVPQQPQQSGPLAPSPHESAQLEAQDDTQKVTPKH